jgi:hypothetical protein
MPPPVTIAGGMRVGAVRKRPNGPSKEKLKLYKQDDKEKKEKMKRLEKNANHRVGMSAVTRRILLAVVGIALLFAALLGALTYFSHLLPSPQALADSAMRAADEHGAVVGSALAALAAIGLGVRYVARARDEARKRAEAQRALAAAREEAERTRQRRKEAAKAALELRLKNTEMSLRERAVWLEEWERKDALRQEEEEVRAAERRKKELQELEIQQQLQRENRRIRGDHSAGLAEVDFGGEEDEHYDAQPRSEQEDEEEEEEEEGEEHEEQEEGQDGEEDDVREPLELELAPAKRGTQIGIEASLWSNIGTLRPHSLRVQAACVKCGTKQDMELSGMFVDAHERRQRCSKCSQFVGLSLRPCIAHEKAPVLAFFDRENAAVADILSVQLLASCMDCSEDCILPPAVRGARAEANCHGCHKKLAVIAKAFPLVVYESQDSKALDRQASSSSSKGGRPRAAVGLTEGEPLPEHGACEHFKKSLRWLRFGCCGRAYPCPICHEKSDCPEADMGVRATRMICGSCSREQNFSSSPCLYCGFSMDKNKASAHWEGGGGARNTTLLSDKDRRKNKGTSREGTRKTASKKAQRVGVQGKKAREAKQG